MVTDQGLTEKYLTQSFATLVADYEQALMLQQRLNPFPRLSNGFWDPHNPGVFGGITRTVLAQTPDGHYALIEAPVHSWLNKLIASDSARSDAGCTHYPSGVA